MAMQKTDWTQQVSPNTVIVTIKGKDYAVDIEVAACIKALMKEVRAAQDRIVELMRLTEKKS